MGEGGWCVCAVRGRGLCGRGRALKISHQSAGARGRRQSRQKCSCVPSGAEICAQLDEKEKSGVRMELRITGISHAGCFLLNGLPKEYYIQSDLPHSWVNSDTQGRCPRRCFISEKVYVSLFLGEILPCFIEVDLEFNKGHISSGFSSTRRATLWAELGESRFQSKIYTFKKKKKKGSVRIGHDRATPASVRL